MNNMMGNNNLNPLPNKPLFPSVSGTANTNSPSAIVGADFKPIPSPLSKPVLATVAMTSGTSKIVHPEEDVSLEEMRSRQARYKALLQQAHQQSQEQANREISQAVYSTPSGAHFPRHQSMHQQSMHHSSMHPPGVRGHHARGPPMFAGPMRMPPPPPASFQPTFRPAFQ